MSCTLNALHVRSWSMLVTWSPFLPCGSCGLALSKCPALGWWRWVPASICYWSSAQWRSLRHLAGGACWRVMTRDAMPCMRCTLHTSAHNAMCDELSSDMSRLDLISFCLIIVVLVDSIFDSVWLYLILWCLTGSEQACVAIGTDRGRTWKARMLTSERAAFRHARFGFSRSQAGAVARPKWWCWTSRPNATSWDSESKIYESTNLVFTCFYV